MNNNGKILFFNANDGKGIIITASKEKISFSVEDWDDFETMPTLGLEVCFVYENSTAYHIISLENYVEVERVQSENEVALVTQTSEEEQEPQEELASQVQEREEQTPEDLNEHFEDEKDINKLTLETPIEDEIGEREESVTVTLNLSNAVRNYFDVIKENIDKRESYKKVDGRLNYLLIRSFYGLCSTI